MASEAGAPTTGGSRTFVFRPQAVIAATIQDHGAQLVDTRTIYDMSLRFRYFIADRNRDMINIVAWHKNTINTMLKTDPVMKVVPNDDTFMPYSDMSKFPTNKESFKQQFTETSELFGTRGQSITVCHSVKASMSLWHMKWRCDTLMPYLMKNSITIISDKFDKAVISSIGFFMNINPHWVHRETFQDKIYQIIEDNINLQDPSFHPFTKDITADEEGDVELLEELEVPDFELAFTPVKVGSGST
jgi:hypothetical protein